MMIIYGCGAAFTLSLRSAGTSPAPLLASEACLSNFNV